MNSLPSPCLGLGTVQASLPCIVTNILAALFWCTCVRGGRYFLEISREMKQGGIFEENKRELTSAQIFPTVEMVSTGYNPLRVSAPRRIASLPEETEKHIEYFC